MGGGKGGWKPILYSEIKIWSGNTFSLSTMSAINPASLCHICSGSWYKKTFSAELFVDVVTFIGNKEFECGSL